MLTAAPANFHIATLGWVQLPHFLCYLKSKLARQLLEFFKLGLCSRFCSQRGQYLHNASVDLGRTSCSKSSNRAWCELECSIVDDFNDPEGLKHCYLMIC
jgi:hypothetical protein